MRKIFTLLMTIFMCFGLFLAHSNKVNAESNEQESIETYEQLKSFLLSNDTRTGILSGTSDYIVLDQMHVKGTKTLDLNGKTIKGNFVIQPDPRKSDYKEHIIYVDEGASLTINDTDSNKKGTIDGDNKDGGIMNDGILVINQANIINGNSHSGAGVYNDNTFTMNGGLIKKCHQLEAGVPGGNDGYGGGVYNHNGEQYGRQGGAIFNFNGGEITECEALYGGGVYIAYPGTFVMGSGDVNNPAKITKCSATFSGGALNGVGKVTLKTGSEITDNYSLNCAIVSSLDFVIEGTVNIKNVHNNERKDIFVSRNIYNEPLVMKLTMKSGAQFVDSPVTIDMTSFGYATESFPYIYSEIGSVKNMFNTIEADQYLEEDNNNTVYIKKVKISDQPTSKNDYTVTIDNSANSGITAAYEWHLASNYSKVQIGAPGKYKTDYIDINVSPYLDDTIYKGNYIWQGSDGSLCLNLDGLKKDQLVSFNYKYPTSAKNKNIYLEGDTVSVTERYVNQDESSYAALIPEDGDYVLRVYCDETGSGEKIEISNIYVKETDYGVAIPNETQNKLQTLLPENNVYCEITLTNANNSKTKIIKSNVIEFEPIAGDKEFYLNSNSPLTLRIDATNEDYDYFLENGEIYLNGPSGYKFKKFEDYTVSKGSIVIKIKPNVLKKLVKKDTVYTIYANGISSNAGKSIATTQFIVRSNEKPTPDPGKKDESCEKVIGPTWHWNNTKGICEDYGVVGTYTR